MSKREREKEETGKERDREMQKRDRNRIEGVEKRKEERGGEG